MRKNDKKVILGQKMIFCGQKKTKMPTESPMDFFMEGLRMLKSSNAEIFSLAGNTFV